MLFADVNNFHDINNTYGHAAGDDLLRAFGLVSRRAGRLTSSAAGAATNSWACST